MNNLPETITIETKNSHPVGENISVVEEGNYLILIVDLTKEIGLSSTGKMMGVASTAGFTFLSNTLKGNVYIGKKA